MEYIWIMVVYGNLVYNVGGFTVIRSYNSGEPAYPLDQDQMNVITV